MAQFDVYIGPEGTDYLLDVQADLLGPLNTRVVVPLLRQENAPEPAQYLNPMFTIKDYDIVMVTQFLAAVPASILVHPVANLSNHFAEISNALDMIFQGF